jgi:hypothetical protein
MKVVEFFALACVLVPPHTGSADDGFVVQNQVRAPAGHSLERTVQAARRRLGRPQCQRILSEYSDAWGRTLQENLDVLGRTGGDHLGQILFADGTGRRPCRPAGGPFAFTRPGSRVVYVCAHQFERLAEKDRRMAEAMVIHEALHTLGLGENPPTSAEITERVLARCW